jgi:hypothetical protein
MFVDDSQHLLDLLQAHGQQFLESFNLPESVAKKPTRKRKRDDEIHPKQSPRTSFDSDEEWGGIEEDEDENSMNKVESSSDYGDHRVYFQYLRQTHITLLSFFIKR